MKISVLTCVDQATHENALTLSPKVSSDHLLRRPVVYLEVFKSALLMNIACDIPKLSHTFPRHLTIGALSTHYRSSWRSDGGRMELSKVLLP